jgi:asparagine synthase (glutamine-hydrolysing)
MFHAARSVKPGETVTFDRSGTCTRSVSLPWFPVAPWAATEAQAFEAVGRALDVAIDRSLVADVPVGLLLSGGLDSNLLLAELRARSPRDEIHAFTAVGGDKRGEEVRAEKFAQRFNATHHVVRLSPYDFIKRARQMSQNRDSPISEPADIFIDAVAERAQGYVKVLLSGEGADEVFGGYAKYRKSRVGVPIGSALRALPESVRRQLPERVRVLSRVGGATRELRDASWFASLSADEISNLGFHLSPNNASSMKWDKPRYDRVQTMMISDMLTWLPGNLLSRADRCAMRHSVEARPPLLDIDLVRLGLSLPIAFRAAGSGKKILRAVAASRHGQDLAQQPKQGFPVPINEWLVGPFTDDVRHSAVTIMDQFGYAKSRRANSMQQVARLPSKAQWAILSLGMWLEERQGVSS